MNICIPKVTNWQLWQRPKALTKKQNFSKFGTYEMGAKWRNLLWWSITIFLALNKRAVFPFFLSRQGFILSFCVEEEGGWAMNREVCFFFGGGERPQTTPRDLERRWQSDKLSQPSMKNWLFFFLFVFLHIHYIPPFSGHLFCFVCFSGV